MYVPFFLEFLFFGHFLHKTRSDVFALFHDHHAVQNFPFQRFHTVVFDDELRFPRRNRQCHGVALFVIDADIDLGDLFGQYGAGEEWAA